MLKKNKIIRFSRSGLHLSIRLQREFTIGFVMVPTYQEALAHGKTSTPNHLLSDVLTAVIRSVLGPNTSTAPGDIYELARSVDSDIH